MRVVAITDIGLKRKRNEDRYLMDTKRQLFVVCDGMGGHKGGDVASTLAVDTLNDSFDAKEEKDISSSLLQSVEKANALIWKMGQADSELHEMGTTITAAVIYDDHLYIAHVGDSSLFIIRDQSIHKVSQDHTLAEQMIRDGLMKREDEHLNRYHHVLTRALGVDQKIEVDLYTEKILTGDQILLCTDGLTDLLEEQEIAQRVQMHEYPEEVVEELVTQALDKGGHDNITIILISV